MRTIEEDDIECRCNETDKKCKEKGREGTGQEKVVKTGKQREREKKVSFLISYLSTYTQTHVYVCLWHTHIYIYSYVCIFVCMWVSEYMYTFVSVSLYRFKVCLSF